MDKILLRIPKNLITSKIKISLGIIFFGGVTLYYLYMVIIEVSHDIRMIFIAFLPLFSGYFLYYFVKVFIREMQLLFDEEGVHSVFRIKGKRIVESIPWSIITKVELHRKNPVNTNRGNALIIHCKIPKDNRHYIDKAVYLDLSLLFSFEGFRIDAPAYEPRIKKGLEQICKDKHIQFVLT